MSKKEEWNKLNIDWYLLPKPDAWTSIASIKTEQKQKLSVY